MHLQQLQSLLRLHVRCILDPQSREVVNVAKIVALQEVQKLRHLMKIFVYLR